MCSLSHGVAPHGASPLNHRSIGTLICPVCARDALRNTIWSCHIELVVVVSWICTLAAYWHLTNMFSSPGARHTPHRHARTQLFRSSIRICQHWCCVRADVQPGVCAHHAFIVCVFIPRGTYFRRSFALSPFSTSDSLGYRAACCWQGVHFFMCVSVEPASSMHILVRHSTSRTPQQKLRDPRRVSRAKFASRAFV